MLERERESVCVCVCVYMCVCAWLPLFWPWLEFLPGEILEKHVLAWEKLWTVCSGFTIFLFGLFCLNGVYWLLFAKCTAKGTPHSDLFKIKTTVQMTNFKRWQACWQILPYPQKQGYLVGLKNLQAFRCLIGTCNESSLWVDLKVHNMLLDENCVTAVCTTISDSAQPGITKTGWLFAD